MLCKWMVPTSPPTSMTAYHMSDQISQSSSLMPPTGMFPLFMHQHNNVSFGLPPLNPLHVTFLKDMHVLFSTTLNTIAANFVCENPHRWNMTKVWLLRIARSHGLKHQGDKRWIGTITCLSPLLVSLWETLILWLKPSIFHQVNEWFSVSISILLDLFFWRDV